MDLLVPDMVDDRYKVLDVIGTGAMATVYSAEDTRLGRKVAMKILRPEQAQDQTFRIRFKREAEAVASLNYPRYCGGVRYRCLLTHPDHTPRVWF